jgi:hypothetical protein
VEVPQALELPQIRCGKTIPEEIPGAGPEVVSDGESAHNMAGSDSDVEKSSGHSPPPSVRLGRTIARAAVAHMNTTSECNRALGGAVKLSKGNRAPDHPGRKSAQHNPSRRQP